MPLVEVTYMKFSDSLFVAVLIDEIHDDGGCREEEEENKDCKVNC